MLDWAQTEYHVPTGWYMHSPHSRGLRGGRRGHPPHGWREPPGTQTPLPQTRATALPSPLSSRHCLRLSAGGRVRLRGCRLLRTMQREWHSNLLLLLVPTLEVTSLANITMLACYSALLMPTGTALVQQQLAGSSVFIACVQHICAVVTVGSCIWTLLFSSQQWLSVLLYFACLFACRQHVVLFTQAQCLCNCTGT